MAEMQVYDVETNEPSGKISVPDDVIAAAAKVAAYLERNEGLILYGLKLADE